MLVEEGEIEVADPVSGERLRDATLGPGQFMGELGFLNGGPMTLTMRAAVPTRTIEAPRAAMLQLMSDVPEIGDHILTVFAARRRAHLRGGRQQHPGYRRRSRSGGGAGRQLPQPQPPALPRGGRGGAGRVDHGQEARRSHPAPGRASLRPRSQGQAGRFDRPHHRRGRTRRGRRRGLCRLRRAARPGGRGQCDRRAGGDQQPDRELHGLPDRHLGRGPRLSRAGPGDEVRHLLRHAAPGRGADASATTASASRSTMARNCAPAPCWSRPGCNIAACRSTGSKPSKAPASIMRRPRWKRASAAGPKRSWSAAATALGKPPCIFPEWPIRFTCWCVAPALRRP